MEEQEEINENQGQDVGTIRLRKVNIASVYGQYYMVELGRSLQNPIMKKNGLPPGGRVLKKVPSWWIISSVLIWQSGKLVLLRP